MNYIKAKKPSRCKTRKLFIGLTTKPSFSSRQNDETTKPWYELQIRIETTQLIFDAFLGKKGFHFWKPFPSRSFGIKRSGRDSNPRPHAWQACILTNWTTKPSLNAVANIQPFLIFATFLLKNHCCPIKLFKKLVRYWFYCPLWNYNKLLLVLRISRNPEASGTKPQIKHTVYCVLATLRVKYFYKKS